MLRSRSRWIVGMLASLTVCGAQSSAAEMTYQGELLRNGTPFTGTAKMRFGLCKNGSTVWSNDGTNVGGQCGVGSAAVNVNASNGIFSVILGGPGTTMIVGPAAADLGGAVIRVQASTDNGATYDFLPDQTLASAPTAMGVSQVDPAATNFLARWDGTKLAYGGVFSDPNGNVGIGTSLPADKLHVNGGAVRVSDPNGAKIYLTPQSLNHYRWRLAAQQDVNGGFEIGASTTPGSESYSNRMVLTATGNMGIGTNSPSSLLHIRPNSGSASTPAALRIDMTGGLDGSPNSVLLGADGSQFSGVAYLDTANSGIAASTPLSLRVSGIERMRLQPNGNIGIGTQFPGGVLTVRGNDDHMLLTNPTVPNAGSMVFNDFAGTRPTGAITFQLRDPNGVFLQNGMSVDFHNRRVMLPTLGWGIQFPDGTVQGTASFAAPGPQGPTGPTGPQGPIGMQGPDGNQGPIGPIGFQGPIGPQGPPGVNGSEVIAHEWTGTQLRIRNTGGVWGPFVDLRGPIGPAGPAGPQGIQGLTGPQGADGPQGPQGIPGPSTQSVSICSVGGVECVSPFRTVSQSLPGAPCQAASQSGVCVTNTCNNGQVCCRVCAR